MIALQLPFESARSLELCDGMRAGLAAANVLSFLGAVVTVFEKHDENFALKGGGLGADLDVLQDIRQSDAAPLRLRDGGPGTYFYGDLWKVHWS